MAMLRPTHIPWIGEIPSKWDVIKLKYASLLKGRIGWQGLTTDEYRSDGPYLVTGTDFENGIVAWQHCHHVSEERYKLDIAIQIKEDDLLITKDGTIGKVAISKNCPDKVCLNSGIFIIRNIGRYKYYSRFMYYVLQSDELQLWFSLTDRGNSTVKHLTQEKFYNFSFAYPPLSEQQAIADYLDDRCSKIDEIIAEATASIEEYKELKQAMIFEAVTKGLEKNVPMKDSGVEWIGQIPNNWALVRIPRILDYKDHYPLGDGDHGMIKTDDYQSNGIPYIRVQNLGWGTDLLLDNVVYISEKNNEKIKSSQLKPNDVLFCKTGGTIGKTGIVPETLPVSNTTSHVGKITVDPAYNPRYVFYVLSSNVGYRQFWEIACQKTTRPELSIAETRQIRLTWPSSRKEQDAIVKYLDAIVPEYDSLISEKQSLIEDLQAYKKSLIYEVVTGKRRVV